MKKTIASEVVLNNQRNGASISTQVKNTFEAYRAGVATGGYSSEYAYAKCGCCHDRVPKIDGVWDQEKYKFLKEPYDINGEHLRVHPSLWNNGTNNVLSGVFEVLPGKIYQVRGYDMANITFVKTNNIDKSKLLENDRWMVMDTLMSIECTQAALELFDEYLKTKNSAYSLKGNIVGMIVSHSHVDHYGGMRAVKGWCMTTDAYYKMTGKTPTGAEAIPFILAPAGFFEHSVSENVYVGNAMGRRASYQYGSFIKPDYNENGETDPNDYLSGEISIGIGQGQSTGSISFEIPTMEITDNPKLTLDELQVEFQLTPGTEAPAEMNNYFSDYNALWLAENCNGTLHNLYTLRGAQVRDGKAWAKYLMETVVLYGDKTDVIFQSHNWPHWDNSLDSGCIPTNGADDKFPRTDLKAFLIDTAAIYKYINDQTLLYMNMGYKMNEASDMLTLPRAMQENWCLKPFYGTPKHNAKAVYQRYLGWYDANPLHLEELPPELLAKEQMRYMTSSQDIVELIRSDMNAGKYWIAAYMAHQVVLGSSDKAKVEEAKTLCADALEQLGYQSESGTWRNAYLCAAYELRNGKKRISATSGEVVEHMTNEMLLDYIAIFFDGYRAANLNYDNCIGIEGTEKDIKEVEYFRFIVKNGALLYYPTNQYGKADIVKRSELISAISGQSIPACEIFYKIFKSMVNIKTDRFAFFDIMEQHDSSVKSEDSQGNEVEYNLRKAVYSCILMFEKYIPKLSGSDTAVRLNDMDFREWNRWRSLLQTETSILLDATFFTPGDATLGIGNDGVFLPLELYYVLFELYRYLNQFYVKNDVYDETKATVSENYFKLKKKIQILESLVSDFYMQPALVRSITLTDDITCALKYLGVEDVSGSITNELLFNLLYGCHKELYELNPSAGNTSGVIQIKHSGAYIARFNISWDEVCYNSDGVEKTTRIYWEGNGEDKLAGFEATISLAGNCRNISILAEARTGFVFDPWHTIMEKMNIALSPNISLEVKGTTLNTAYNFTY